MLSLSSLFGAEAGILRDRDYQLLMLASLMPVLGATLMSPILDSLVGPFETTSSSIGLMISVFTAPAIVMIPAAGALADRFGRKRVLVTALTLFGLAGTAIALTTDYRVVLGLRFLQGIGFSGISPIIITSIGDMYAQEAEATGQGIRFTISGLSGGTFPLIAGGLVLVAWQMPFLLYAIAFPIALGVLLWFDEPARTMAANGGDAGEEGSYVRSLLRLVVHPRVFAMMLARSLMVAVWIAFITYNSFIVVRLLGGSPVEAGALATVGFLTFAVTASQAGRLTSMLDSRLNLLLASNVLLGGGFVVVLFAPGLPVAFFGIIVSSVGFGILGSLYRTIITNLAPATLRAGLVSLSEAGGRVTATLTPFVMGSLIAVAAPTTGFGTALQLTGLGVSAVASGASMLCLLVASAAPPVPAE